MLTINTFHYILFFRLTEMYNVIGSEEALEKVIAQLKSRLQNFTDKEKLSNMYYNKMKTELGVKENELKLMENKINHVILKMENIKQKLCDNSKLRKLCNDIAKQKEKLQKELTDCMKVRYLYEDHADLVKREMSMKIKEKDVEIANHRKEIDRLTYVCVQNESVVKSLVEKLKKQTEYQESNQSESQKMFLHQKQKSSSLHDKLLEKNNENTTLKNEIAMLQVELEKSKSYQSKETLEKDRENTTLREEIAMLRVELEKGRPRMY